MTGLEAARTRPLWRLLVGLSIRDVGAPTAQALARSFRSLDALAAADVEQVQQVEGIGPKTAAVIVGWFVDERHQRHRASGIRAGGANVSDEGTDDGAAPARRHQRRGDRHASRATAGTPRPRRCRPAAARSPAR